MNWKRVGDWILIKLKSLGAWLSQQAKVSSWNQRLWFCAILGFLIFWYIQDVKYKRVQILAEVQAVQLMSVQDTVRQLHTKKGELYVQIKSIGVEKSNLEKTIEAMGLKVKDLTAMGIKKDDVIAVLKLQIEAAGTIHTPVHETVIHDTVPGFYKGVLQTLEPWSNGHLFLTGTIKDKIFDADYQYKTGMVLVPEQKGKSIVVTAKLDDPKAKILTGQQINVVYKVHWYEKPWVWGAAGFVGGIIVNK